MGEAARGSNSIEDQIIVALQRSKRGCLMAPSIAGAIKKSLTLVSRELDRMVREGKLGCDWPDGGNSEGFYRLVVQGRRIGALPPRAGEAEEGDGDGGDDGLIEVRAENEQTHAAAKWKALMGDQRWRDDPRALAEQARARQTHLLPFSERQI